MKSINIIAALLILSFTACKKDIKQEGTPVQDMAGEWWVQIYLNDDIYDDTYYLISTYNTASFDEDKMWVDADEAWPFVGKATVDYKNLAFVLSEPIYEDYYKDNFPPSYGFDTDTITITGGNVLKNVSTPPSGTTTDSINIEFISTVFDELDLDAGDRYALRGYRKTGFFEDEH